MSRQRVPTKGGAISTVKAQGRSADAKLLRLEGEFIVAVDVWDAAGARTALLEEKLDRIRKLLDQAADEELKKGDVMSRAFFRVMKTRAKSLDGMLAKLRVRGRWNTNDETSEIAILKSLVKDLKGMSG